MVKLPKMRIKDVGICMLLLALLFFSLLGTALEEREIIQGLISGFHLNSASQDENLVEVIAANCGLELRHLMQVYEDLGFSVHNTPSTCTGFSLDDQAWVEENVKSALSNLRPQIKESLFNCVWENRHIRPASGQDVVLSNMYPKNLLSLLPKANSRRYMAEAPSPSKSSGSTKSPAPSPSKSRAPSPAKSPAPAPSRGSANSGKDSDSKGPPSKDKGKGKGKGKDSGDELVIPIPIDGKDKDGKGSGSESSTATADGKSEGHSSTTLIIALGATAGAVVVVVTLLVICCRRFCGKSADFEHKDDRPLLSLSMSDHSVNGSDKANNQPYLGNLNDGKGAVSLDSLESATGTNTSPAGLKPPPRRAPVGGSGLPPLKPPPGRTDLSPPEGSLKPPPGPPPPPPPKAPPPPPPKKPAAPPPPGPPPPPGKGGPRGPPPPPGKGGARPPPAAMKAGSSSDGDGKTKLKPFFWDKVTANPDESMVWNQIKAGSFQFNEEMIESLFGYAAADKDKKGVAARREQPQYVQIIDQKKAQNLSILLRALNVTTDEVRDALLEGNELPSELLETLIRMAPTSEEELKLRLYNGPIEQLGPAERFLKVLVDIPFAIKRMESLLFMGTLQEEAANVKEAFITLEAACKELRGSRLFLKLLEAVLKTGNRMNDGTYRGGAQAFKLDTLLKLSDVKGTDGKMTLLHFVVQEIVRSEGIRAVRAFRESKSISSIKSEDLTEDIPDDSEEHYRNLGLQAVSSLGSQLENVRKAAGLDGDGITGTVAKLGTSLIKTRDFINKDMADVEGDKGFHEALKSFVEHAEGEVTWLLEEEKRIVALIKKTGDYFHGNSGKEEGLRLFVIVRDFVLMLEKVCKEVKEKPRWPASKAAPKKDPPTRQTSAASASETPRTPMTPDFRQKLFPAIAERRQEGSCSGSDSDSDD